MKLELDTTNKTIKISEDVNLGELVTQLESLLPNEKWKEFELQTNVEFKLDSPNPHPIIIERDPIRRPNWWEQPYITYDTNSPLITADQKTNTVGDYDLNNGVYQIEIKS